GDGVGRVCVAVEELDALGGVNDGVVHRGGTEHGAHGHGAAGQALGHGHDVRRYGEFLGGSEGAGATKTADHFVKDQQDVVGAADLPQALQVAARGNDDAAGAGDGLDYDTGDIFRTVQQDKVFPRIGVLDTEL